MKKYFHVKFFTGEICSVQVKRTFKQACYRMWLKEFKKKRWLANIFINGQVYVDQYLKCYRLCWLEYKFIVGYKIIRPLHNYISDI